MTNQYEVEFTATFMPQVNYMYVLADTEEQAKLECETFFKQHLAVNEHDIITVSNAVFFQQLPIRQEEVSC